MSFVQSLKDRLRGRQKTDRERYRQLLEKASAGDGKLSPADEDELLRVAQTLNRSPDDVANDAAVVAESIQLQPAIAALPSAEIQAKKDEAERGDYCNKSRELLSEHDEARKTLERERDQGYSKLSDKHAATSGKVYAGKNAVRRLAELRVLSPAIFDVDAEEAKKQLDRIRHAELAVRGRVYRPDQAEAIQPPVGYDDGDDIAVDVSPDDVWREKEIANANRAASAEIAAANPLTKTRQTQEFMHS